MHNCCSEAISREIFTTAVGVLFKDVATMALSILFDGLSLADTAANDARHRDTEISA
jgi:hypothetical protein